MRRLSIVLLAAAAVAMSVPALAQVGAANNPMPNSASPGSTSMSIPETNPSPTGDASLDEVVCKNEPAPTGSRIGGSRTCKTNREWLADEDALNRARTSEGQTQIAPPGAFPAHGPSGMGH
jgi:hypothetical protein